ncbi:MAG TPA: class I SAM-dependent methyltransferase, partial [Desulfobacteraceae bacterium]|nr:class I SAM-dependent methyltransferase [Desulfobacteraceae bacterium]
AGTGNFSEYLLQAGVRHLLTFEPSNNMYPLLEERFRNNSLVETRNAYFDSHDFHNTFDSMLYVNVLEHIKDDREAMRHAHAALKPGGHVLIFVPALSFLYSELDRKVGHFRRYARRELVDVVGSAGFLIKKAQYFDIAGIIPWYIAFVLCKQTTTAANVSLYDRLIVPIMRRVERIIPPFTGKNLVLVGQKNSRSDDVDIAEKQAKQK